MTDLTEYVDAAARAMYADYCPGRDWGALSPLQQLAFRESVTPIVAAVAPLIEREAKAAALEEAAGEFSLPGSDAGGYYGGYCQAGYHEAETHAETWLRDRARAIREGR